MIRHDVPRAWAHEPEAWWEHVANCDVCRRFWERP
jgi:hypothetical protein